ncbi:glycosyltransferase family 2 protein [Corallococcus silvisoli]|uniref:glycosyltransferase family 2 protein n=1 Tax=Corallococcus silvisoli TaxID=2697031 RepID=UPI001377E1FF|nr:glycosyltransferase family 2 protein [Corallococcus silvisoli]NBD14042.1 glycosyltransferase [Corallococcus silvisoli]
MTKPSVSVIIPAYNVEAYLGAAIDSVFEQSHPSLEIVIVDDCSRDRTVEVAERYQDARIRVLRNEQNQGPSQSRNIAIDHAQGEWVAVLDADDWWKPQRLERLLALAETSQAAIVCDDLLLVPEGEPHPKVTFFQTQARRWGRIEKPFQVDALKMAVDDYGFLKPMFRKSFLDARELRYKPALRAGEDFEFLLRCLLGGGQMVVSHEAMYCYRSRADSLTADPVKCLTRILDMADELLGSLDPHAHGQVVEAMGLYRGRKQGELEDARFRGPLQKGAWGECMALALRNPAKLPRYMPMVGRQLLALAVSRARGGAAAR